MCARIRIPIAIAIGLAAGDTFHSGDDWLGFSLLAAGVFVAFAPLLFGDGAKA